jgi:hypothetical protein
MGVGFTPTCAKFPFGIIYSNIFESVQDAVK